MSSPPLEDTVQTEIRDRIYEVWRVVVRKERRRRLGRWWFWTAAGTIVVVSLVVWLSHISS